MTQSYGSGRKLDDSKALVELQFEVGGFKNFCMPCLHDC